MKRKLVIGVMSTALVLGGVVAVGASKSEMNTVPVVSIDDDVNQSSIEKSAANQDITIKEAEKIALSKVNGTITEVEKEIEHGKLEYKFEIQSNRGEVEIRVDAETANVTRIEYDDDRDDDGQDDDDRNDWDDDDRDDRDDDDRDDDDRDDDDRDDD